MSEKPLIFDHAALTVQELVHLSKLALSQGFKLFETVHDVDRIDKLCSELGKEAVLQSLGSLTS
jgi:hypothetical protein